MTYIEVNTHQVWVRDTQTPQQPLVLLHGGFGTGDDFDGNLAELADQYRVFAPDRRGHGRTADNDGPLSQHEMAQDTIALIESLPPAPVRIVGYSDGAVVALLVALARPALVERLVLISGVFHPEGWIIKPDPDSTGDYPAEMVERYGELSPDGIDHFPVIARKLAAIADEDLGISEDRLARLNMRCLVMVADDDLVHAEHTLTLYRSLPQAELAIVPGTSHDLLHDKSDLVTHLVADFLASEPPVTAIPIRRGAVAD